MNLVYEPGAESDDGEIMQPNGMAQNAMMPSFLLKPAGE